jgi:hypothetical protein
VNWIKQLFSRRRLYNDLSEEIREHLREKIEELVASGTPGKEAAAAAHREFGNVTLIEQDGRVAWQWPSVENFFTDIRYTLHARQDSGIHADRGDDPGAGDWIEHRSVLCD